MFDTLDELGVLLPLIFSALAFLYAFINLIRYKRGLYYRFCTLGLFAICMGKGFIYLLHHTGGDSDVFSIGSLGSISGYLFFYFANSQFLSKLEDREFSRKRRYIYLPFILPAVLVGCYIVLLLSGRTLEEMIIPSLMVLTCPACVYYQFKYSIIPDTKGGFISCMRPFNIVACVYALIPMAVEMSWLMVPYSASIVIYSMALLVIACITYVLLAVLLERGAKKWII